MILISLLLGMAIAWFWPGVAQASFSQDVEITPVKYTLDYFTLDRGGNALAAKGRILYRIVSAGDSAQAIYTFPNYIQGIHVMASGAIVVSTDDDRWDPKKPCRIYLSRDGGMSFKPVKSIQESCALWWSLASDRRNNLYVGEYGPRGLYQSKNVWKTADYGKTWKVVFHAPNLDGVHIHRVAVDPYTDFLWVTHGDRDYQGTYLSRDGEETWTRVRKAQPTSVVFTEDAIYWGEDTALGLVTRYDRATGKIDTVLQASKLGNYGGSVYDMARGKTGLIYVPMVKYAEQNHLPTLWVGEAKNWELLLSLGVEQGKAGGFSQISPPDKYGFLYVRGFKIRDATFSPFASPSKKAEEGRIPQGYALKQNFPNPFNAETVLSYFLPCDTNVQLSIYNASGQRVRILVEEAQSAGEHRVSWDGTDERGEEVGNGIYLCRLKTPRFQQSRSLVLLK